MPRERILVTVKTYPTLSRKHGETVCTAGIREDGSWVRVYPVPFRRLGEKEQYGKFDWVECDLRKSTKDPRPETYHPTDVCSFRVVGHSDTRGHWRERRQILLHASRVHTSMKALIAAAKANELSLAVFKPTHVTGFTWEEEEREWNPDKVREMRNLTSQGGLFAEDAWRKTFRLIPKLPYSFSYRLEDAEGRVSELQILDWEIGALYWNCLRRANGDEKTALAKVREKYWDRFLTTDLHFFLGTTQQFHLRAPNPWVIVGVVPIPSKTGATQPELF
jgi:hypothetical protein